MTDQDQTQTTQNTEPQSGNNERLQALQGMAQEVDALNPNPAALAAQAEQEQAEQEQETGAQAWASLALTLGGVLSLAAPELKKVYTVEKCTEWGTCMQAVADKHGWSAPGNSPEMALAISSLGLVIPSFFAVRQVVKDANAASESWLGKVVWWWKRRKAEKNGSAE